MIEVRSEVDGGFGSFTLLIRVGSISEASDEMRALYPSDNIRMVFPVDSEGFFGGGGLAPSSFHRRLRKLGRFLEPCGVRR